MLAAARKAPGKTNWKALRRAFARTSYYHPYSVDWRKDLAQAVRSLQAGKLEDAETALVKLLERDHFMRLEEHAVAAQLYQKMGQPAKEQLHRAFVEGFAGTIFVPGHGLSAEKPIEVLFLDEEYLFLGSLGLRPKKQQLMEIDGHRFDVLTTVAKGENPERDYYFNIDLPQGELRRELTQLFAAPDREFEALLAAARKAPEKTDWKRLRSAFAATSQYKPFNTEWPREIRAIAQDFAAGRLKETEAALVKILERERFMRIEAHSLAAELYQKKGDAAKARLHRAFFDGMTRAAFGAGLGTSFEAPIELLFADEQALYLGVEHVKVKEQKQVEHDGLPFVVVTAEAEGNKPGRTYYFLMPMPGKAIQKALQKRVDTPRKPAVKR